MDPITLAALGFSALSSIPQWVTGYRQDKRADELSKGLERPTMEIPESQKRALGLAENLAEMDRLPGQGATEGRLDQTTANTIAMIERMGIGGPTSINAASTAYGNQLEKETDLGVKAAEFKVRNQMNLQNELGDQAQWEQEAWKWNTAQPYQNKVNAIEALKEGSIRNKNAAWKNIAGIGASFFGGMAGNGEGWWNQPIGGGEKKSQITSITGENMDQRPEYLEFMSKNYPEPPNPTEDYGAYLDWQSKFGGQKAPSFSEWKKTGGANIKSTPEQKQIWEMGLNWGF